MKIVMLCEFYNDNLEFQENLLAKYYNKHNHQVVIITSTFTSIFDYYSDNHDPKLPAKTHVINGVKIIRLKYAFNILNRLRRYTNIYEILEEERPGLIFVHDISPNMLEAVKYKKKHQDCSIIMDYHADFSNSAKNWISLNILHKILRKYYLDRSRKYIDKIFPVVPASTKFLHEVYEVPMDEMELLPLGADTDVGNDTRINNEGSKIRSKYGIPIDDVVIFTGGKFEPKKKTELLIDAFHILKDPKLHLFIIGDASSTSQIYKKSLIAHSKENQNIHFIGWLSSADIYKYMNACELAVFPAHQSILWQQAISMYLPLIVGNIGHQDISYLNEYGNIIILDKNKITAKNIAENISTLLSSNQILNDMKSGAIKITDEMLNWDKLIMKTLKYTKQGTTQKS